jgi:hypothetical protein
MLRCKPRGRARLSAPTEPRPDGAILADDEAILPDASRVRAPKLRRLINLWHVARDGDAGMPRKARIDPIDLARAGLLPQIWLVERQPDRRLVYRLAGEEINAVFGRSVAGAALEDLIERSQAEMVVGRWNRVLDEALVMHAVGEVYSDAGNLYSGERVVLPLADEQGAPMFLIGATEYRLLGSEDRAGRPALADLRGVRRSFVPVDRIAPLPAE